MPCKTMSSPLSPHLPCRQRLRRSPPRHAKYDELSASRKCLRSIVLHPDNSTQRFALVHELEGSVDVPQVEVVRHVRINLHLLVHVGIHQARNLRPALITPEGGTLPHAACHQLEGPGGDFLPCARNTDDDALAPADVARLERGAHHLHVACAIKGIVHAATCHVNKV